MINLQSTKFFDAWRLQNASNSSKIFISINLYKKNLNFEFLLGLEELES